MKGRMLKHLISFWWWVVDNGGVCVCVGGMWVCTSPTSTTRGAVSV